MPNCGGAYPHRPYTEADRRFVVAAWNAGLNVEHEIAPGLDRSYDATRKYMQSLRRKGELGDRPLGPIGRYRHSK